MGFSEATVKIGFGVDWGICGGILAMIHLVHSVFLKNASPAGELGYRNPWTTLIPRCRLLQSFLSLCVSAECILLLRELGVMTITECEAHAIALYDAT